MERLQGKPARSALILDLVVGDARAARWDFPQRIFVDSYAIETSVGDADPQCSAAFRLLAPGFLGMVGFRGNIRFSLRRCFFNPVANNSNACYLGESGSRESSGLITSTAHSERSQRTHCSLCSEEMP